MAASPRARVLRSLVQWFAVELGPATQMRYRDTALSDTRAVLQNRAAVAVVASMTVAASIAASVTSDLPVVAKVILAAVGAGIGTVVILGPIVFLATLAAAPHRQRNEARSRAQQSANYLEHYRGRLALFRTLDRSYIDVITQKNRGPSPDSLGGMRRNLIDSEYLLVAHGEPAIAVALESLRSKLASIGETPNSAQYADVADEIVQAFATLVSLRGPLFVRTPEIPRQQ